MSLFHIVDDLSELRLVLTELIKCAGHTSLQFDSAESYLSYFNSTAFIAPVAILSDYEMTGLTGLEMIIEVRKKLPFQKAVILSGTPCKEFQDNIESYLCCSLAKPYHFEQLFAFLKFLIQCEDTCCSGLPQFNQTCMHGLDHPCPFHQDDS